MKNIRNKVAIVLLAHSDFESLEISLAAHTKFLPEDVKIFILQNGRGSYDCERTYRVARRYADLFPRNVTVVDWIEPQVAYHAIKSLLSDDCMSKFDYICKVDDDVFPITHDWLDTLCKCYENAHSQYGNDLAYVTSLVNNNPFGFVQLVEKTHLGEEYFAKIAREYIVGVPREYAPCHRSEYPERLLPKSELSSFAYGTGRRNPYVARWIHSKTTLDADGFIEMTQNLADVEVDATERYSINLMMFPKQFWNDIDCGNSSDEFCSHMYCRENNKKIIAALNVPSVHLFFQGQRDENKDLIPAIRDYYQSWLDLPFPISLCPLKEYENENRLRFLERRFHAKKSRKMATHLKYRAYKVLSKITFGKLRNRCLAQARRYKQRL